MGVGANKNYVQDTELILQDNINITADTVGKVATVAKILDLGLAFVEGDLILDFDLVDFGTADEVYEIKLQFSDSDSFASNIVDKLEIRKGDAIAPSDKNKIALGREIVPFNNEIEGIVYRFCRLYIDVTGTTPIINFEGWLAKRS